MFNKTPRESPHLATYLVDSQVICHPMTAIIYGQTPEAPVLQAIGNVLHLARVPDKVCLKQLQVKYSLITSHSWLLSFAPQQQPLFLLLRQMNHCSPFLKIMTLNGTICWKHLENRHYRSLSKELLNGSTNCRP